MVGFLSILLFNLRSSVRFNNKTFLIIKKLNQMMDDNNNDKYSYKLDLFKINFFNVTKTKKIN